MVWSNSPFALFPLVDVPIETIDHILSEGFKGAASSEYPFWLATSTTYTDTPRKPEPHAVAQGQKPPISPEYKSPFVGKKVEDVAKWLRNKPKEVELDSHFFAVLDNTVIKGDVVICRLGGGDLNNMEELDCLRLDAMMAAQELFAAQPGTWEDLRASRGPAKVEY